MEPDLSTGFGGNVKMIAMDKTEKWLEKILAVPTAILFPIVWVFMRMLVYIVITVNYMVYNNRWKPFISSWIVGNAFKK